MAHIGQALAQTIDVELMGPSVGFSIDQLMELAGLSPDFAWLRLVCAGPGNNGGDALVAARHLALFGFRPTVFYPKQPKKDLYINLVKQCTAYGIPFVQDFKHTLAQSDLVLDGIFGFSFSGEIRPPFDTLISALRVCGKPIVSIDIPSGWDVEAGNANGLGLVPEMLVSLTAPKLGVRNYPFKYHYLGGRFVPDLLAQKFSLDIPAYPGSDQVLDLHNVE
ncbi:YjeF N-terminal domain-containing protein [Entophlyctis helioformis]|nr:YjeF N-terminal domain-containing protein [Entophlyctis helioformis]